MREETPHRLYISSLPSKKTLERYRDSYKVRHLINVSAVDINQIYPDLAACGFSVLQFDFPDIFTDGQKLDDALIKATTADTYVKAAEAEQRQAFIQAVQALITQLENDTPTCIFCHRGHARSPLVAATALNHVYGETIQQTLARVRKLHPRSNFTDISYSALLWGREQLSSLAGKANA